MAKQIIHRLIDDLDGSDATETVKFALDGVNYEIDLSGPNGLSLRKALEPYILAGVRVGKGGIVPRPAPARSTAAIDREQNKAIREWAIKTGRMTSDRGRIPVAVVSQFHQAHNAQLTPTPEVVETLGELPDQAQPEPTPEPVAEPVAQPEVTPEPQEVIEPQEVTPEPTPPPAPRKRTPAKKAAAKATAAPEKEAAAKKATPRKRGGGGAVKAAVTTPPALFKAPGS